MHRQRFPSKPSRTCASVNLGFSFTRETEAITIPGVQYPHCNAWHSWNACCIGCNASLLSANPSMVVNSMPSTCAAKTVQDFMDSPFRWTVQAPQDEVSHPILVPVKPADSLMNWTRRVRGSTSSVWVTPFILRLTSTCFPFSPTRNLVHLIGPILNQIRYQHSYSKSLTMPLCRQVRHPSLLVLIVYPPK